MNHKTPSYALTLLAISSLLTACGDKTPVQSSVVAGASDAATASASTTNSNQPTLTRFIVSNGMIQLHAPIDKANDAPVKIDGIAQDNIVFSHHDENEDLTIYVAKLGEPKQDQATYLSKVIETVQQTSTQAATGAVSISTYPVQENRVIYRIGREENGLTLNEACAAIYHPAQIHVACAISPTLSLSEVEATLRQIDPQTVDTKAASAASGSQ